MAKTARSLQSEGTIEELLAVVSDAQKAMVRRAWYFFLMRPVTSLGLLALTFLVGLADPVLGLLTFLVAGALTIKLQSIADDAMRARDVDTEKLERLELVLRGLATFCIAGAPASIEADLRSHYSGEKSEGRDYRHPWLRLSVPLEGGGFEVGVCTYESRLSNSAAGSLREQLSILPTSSGEHAPSPGRPLLLADGLVRKEDPADGGWLIEGEDKLGANELVSAIRACHDSLRPVRRL